MAENGREIMEQPKPSVDKEVRLRSLKEKQNEERQKKLEEIKAQALAAQRFKEQKEHERRRRLEELRIKDDVRRHQVEERKKAITEAERDRLESILKRNQEREARIEAKKRNERSNIVFAFGSSTPRMLDPTDMSVSFWGHRRATSTQNITSASTSLTRRQSERDLDIGNKKRATSAGGLERSGESITPTTPAGCASGYTGRRRTDLVPTIPSRDSSFTSSRKSLNHSPASSRPSSSLSQQSTNSVTSSVNVRHRPSATPRRQRPISIAITGVSHTDKGENKPPLPKSRKSLSRSNEKTFTKSKVKSPVDSTPPKVIQSPSSTTGSIIEEKKTEDPGETQQKPPDYVVPEVQSKPAEIIASEVPESVPVLHSIVEDKNVLEKDVLVTSTTEEIELNTATKEAEIESISESKKEEHIKETDEVEKKVFEENKVAEVIKETNVSESVITDITEINSSENREIDLLSNEMTTSMTKPRITTEEEAKAALAERRRLAREEAERQAEMERLRIEAEQKAELERQQREEEQLRQLAEMQRQAEQERLQEAIREAQKREEEERIKREEEQRLKLLKEEAEKKAREEAERQKAELQERLKNEEKEREARRKRVEAIMLRTRGKNNSNLPSQQNSEDKNENKSDENKQMVENKLNDENKVNENEMNGRKQENGTTKNGKDMDIVDNIIPDETVKNANTVSDTISNTDSINSNNTWQTTQQYDSLM